MITINDINTIGDIKFSNCIIETEFKNYYTALPGDEHYKLLSYISYQYKNEILIDIGTYKGCSALALANNESNHVKSFDLYNYRNIKNEPSNIEFIIDDILKNDYIDLLLSSKFILLDTFHDGIFENELYSHLINIKWSGMLMLDDIYLNDEMKHFWSLITKTKYDLTNIGHKTGTGIILF